MVSGNTVNLSFPCNTLQLINYTLTSWAYYDIILPRITSDSQLGTILIFVKVNSAPTTSSPNTGTVGNLYLGVPSGSSNVFFSNTLTTSTYFLLTNVVYQFVAIKNMSGVYGWLQTA